MSVKLNSFYQRVGMCINGISVRGLAFKHHINKNKTFIAWTEDTTPTVTVNLS